MSLQQNFYYAEAKQAFEKSLHADSTFAMAWARLAMLNFRSQDRQAAEENVARAISLAGNATEYEQLCIRMIGHWVQYDFKKAAAVADSLIRLYPNQPEAYVSRGYLYEDDKNLEAAIKSYQDAIAADSAYAPAVMSLGYAYSSAGDQEKALEQMARYIRLEPSAADPRASYADLLMRVGRYEEALDQYKKSLELKPDYWYAINRIGDIYTIMGRLDDAEKQYDQGFALMIVNRPLEASHLATDAALDLRRGRYKDAMEKYSRALEIDSTNGEAAHGLVYALTELKDFKRAAHVIARIYEELHKRNLTESQTMFGYYLMNARYYTKQGKLHEAEAKCDRAFDYSSPLNRAYVYQQLAEIHLKQKSYESALDALDGALRINPNFPQALLTLTKVYYAKGDRRMTQEIGGRLMALWDRADPDFQDLIDLKKILALRS